MPGRIWKRSGDTHYGYGNGHKVAVFDDTSEYGHVSVFVYRGDRLVKSLALPDVKGAKAWAEKHYLKGTK